MPALTIDGITVDPPFPAETLGDLLGAADAHLAPARRLVTVLRIDGVEEPAFREASVLTRPASSLARIEVESATPQELTVSCLREAAVSLEGLAGAATRAAVAFARGEVQTGDARLVEITNGLGTALAIAGAASLGLGLDVTRVDTVHGTIEAHTDETSRALDALLAARAASDWQAAAAILAQSLEPAVRRWGAACAALDVRSLA